MHDHREAIDLVPLLSPMFTHIFKQNPGMSIVTRKRFHKKDTKMPKGKPIINYINRINWKFEHGSNYSKVTQCDLANFRL